MRYFVLLFLSVILFSNCKKDDDISLFLNYDGDNFTSPTLPAGTFELAARFPSSETNGLNGSQLSVVDFFVTAGPQFTRLKIYGEGDGSTPGDVIFSKEISSDIKVGEWNRIELRDPIILDGQEIWISLRVTLSEQQQSIGCDAGPGHPDGAHVFIDDSETWTTYQAWANESINWNIRGGIE